VPTINLPVQGTGSQQGWSSIVGATAAHEAVDDSATTTHDSDTSYIVIPRLALGLGTVSFRFFDMAEHVIPTSITIRTAMKINAGSPEIEVGFCRGGVTAFSPTTITPGVQYGVNTTIFATNPFNASPWQDGDLDGLEPCVSSVFAIIGTARLTLLSVGLTYTTDKTWLDATPPSGPS